MKLIYHMLAGENAEFKVRMRVDIWNDPNITTMKAAKHFANKIRCCDEKVNALFTADEMAEMINRKLIPAPEEVDLSKFYEAVNPQYLSPCEYEAVRLDPEDLLGGKRKNSELIFKYEEINSMSRKNAFVVVYVEGGYIKDQGATDEIGSSLFISSITEAANRLRDASRQVREEAKVKGMSLDQYELSVPLTYLYPVNSETIATLPYATRAFDFVAPII